PALRYPCGYRVRLLVDGVARREPGAKLAGALRVGARVLPADVGESGEVERPGQRHATLVAPVLPDETGSVGTGLREICRDRREQREALRGRELFRVARCARGGEHGGDGRKLLLELG